MKVAALFVYLERHVRLPAGMPFAIHECLQFWAGSPWEKAGEWTGSQGSALRTFLPFCLGGWLDSLNVHLAGAIAFAAAAVAAERAFLDFGTSEQDLVHSSQDIGYFFHSGKADTAQDARQ